jgi:drug/metabolite transporter (DMT)-like permease
LLVWLLPQISATRMTTRFILAPLLTVLLGIVLEQPGITARIVLGVILMAAGALWLLLASDEDADEGRIGIR